MLLSEARRILEHNGFICEEIEGVTGGPSAGDKFLLYVKIGFESRPLGIITLEEHEGRTWRCVFNKAKPTDVDYYVEEDVAFSHGTYGKAIVYPTLKYKQNYSISDEGTEISIGFAHHNEVCFKDVKNLPFRYSNKNRYFVSKDLDSLNAIWKNDKNTITDDKRVAEILDKNPELKKEFEKIKKDNE